MPQSPRQSCIDISPLGIYLSSSPPQLRPVFMEHLSDWPPDPSEIDPFAPTGFLESPKKDGGLRQVPIVVTQQQQKTPISIAPRVATLRKRHPGSPHRVPLPKPLEPEFSPMLFPSLGDITAASLLPVIGGDLQSVSFGSLFTHHLTVVCFIRHFYYPLCSDYMMS